MHRNCVRAIPVKPFQSLFQSAFNVSSANTRSDVAYVLIEVELRQYQKKKRKTVFFKLTHTGSDRPTQQPARGTAAASATLGHRPVPSCDITCGANDAKLSVKKRISSRLCCLWEGRKHTPMTCARGFLLSSALLITILSLLFNKRNNSNSIWFLISN